MSRCNYCHIPFSDQERAKCKQICDATGHILACKRAETSAAVTKFKEEIKKSALYQYLIKGLDALASLINKVKHKGGRDAKR